MLALAISVGFDLSKQLGLLARPRPKLSESD
jgi:hypothetical protein